MAKLEFFCCGKKFYNRDVIWLNDKNEYVDRCLIVGYCPFCGSPKAELIEYNILTGNLAYDRNKPTKSKNLIVWIENLIKEKAPYDHVVLKKMGSRGGMGFIFGVSNENEHRGYDFNGTLRKSFEVNHGMEQG